MFAPVPSALPPGTALGPTTLSYPLHALGAEHWKVATGMILAPVAVAADYAIVWAVAALLDLLEDDDEDEDEDDRLRFPANFQGGG